MEASAGRVYSFKGGVADIDIPVLILGVTA
jgi:hypothetical protein